MRLPLAALLLQTASAVTGVTGVTPNVFWCSWAGPNQTLTIGGANLSAATEATIAVVARQRGSPGGTSVPAGPNLQLSASAAQLVVPAGLPHGAYKITINAGAPFVCGAPDLWWTQGGAGNSAVAGGWLRVFGRWLALPNAEYNDFDIIFDHFSRTSQLHTTQHAPCAILYFVPVLIAS